MNAQVCRVRDEMKLSFMLVKTTKSAPLSSIIATNVTLAYRVSSIRKDVLEIR
jgi:hypothetical protein